MTTKIAKHLPRRTGKAQKIKMMTQSYRRREERRERNIEKNRRAHARNLRLIGNQVFDTKTQRRKYLDNLSAERRELLDGCK